MKKQIIILWISVWILTIVSAVPKDISPSLDIYEEVKAIVEIGIMKVDSIGFFNGANSVNRYDIADTLYRLIDYVMSTKAITDASQLSSRVADLETKNESFRTELFQLRNRLDIFEVSFSKVELDAIEKRLSGLKDEVIAQMQSLEQRTKFISGYNDFLTAVEQELRTLYTRVDEQASRLTAIEANTGRLLGYLRKYDTLDTWIPTVDASFMEQGRVNAQIDQALQGIGKQVYELLTLRDEFAALRAEFVSSKVLIAEASRIPEIVELQGNQDLRLKNLEAGYSTLLQIQQDLDYLKIENNQFKLENENIKKQLWYAFGVGIGGAIIGIASFLYAYMLWGSTVQ